MTSPASASGRGQPSSRAREGRAVQHPGGCETSSHRGLGIPADTPPTTAMPTTDPRLEEMRVDQGVWTPAGCLATRLGSGARLQVAMVIILAKFPSEACAPGILQDSSRSLERTCGSSRRGQRRNTGCSVSSQMALCVSVTFGRDPEDHSLAG